MNIRLSAESQAWQKLPGFPDPNPRITGPGIPPSRHNVNTCVADGFLSCSLCERAKHASASISSVAAATTSHYYS